MRVVDRSVLKLIRMWLKAPVVEDNGHGGKRVHRSSKGTPQGGVIAPRMQKVTLASRGTSAIQYVRRRLMDHLQRRSQRPFRPPKGRSYFEHLKQLGLIYLK